MDANDIKHARSLGSGKGDGAKLFNEPWGMCCDEDFIFVADTMNNKVGAPHRQSRTIMALSRLALH